MGIKKSCSISMLRTYMYYNTALFTLHVSVVLVYTTLIKNLAVAMVAPSCCVNCGVFWGEYHKNVTQLASFVTHYHVHQRSMLPLAFTLYVCYIMQPTTYKMYVLCL